MKERFTIKIGNNSYFAGFTSEGKAMLFYPSTPDEVGLTMSRYMANKIKKQLVEETPNINLTIVKIKEDKDTEIQPLYNDTLNEILNYVSKNLNQEMM